MKKLFFLSCFIAVALASCSSDSGSSENSPSENLLLKKIVEGDVILGGTITTYTYDGNKLIEININDEYFNKYTYTGNVITKIEKYLYDQLMSTDEFEYNTNNQLTHFITTTPESDVERVTTYVYNSNNTVTFEQNEYFPGDEPELLKTGTITMENGEIVKLQVVKEFDSYTDNYSYDTKNSLFKNVLGYDKLILTHIIGQQGSFTMVDSILGGISHNFVNNGEFEYTYNSDNYPLTAEQSWFGTVLHSYEFIYE